MALETGTFIDDLVATNPVAGDLVNQGDDHIRLLKEVLRNSFPGLSEAVAIESGVWTPTFDFATPGDLSVAYAAQEGMYFRVGPVIFINFRLTFTPTYTTASGAGQWEGLPFQVNAAVGAVTPVIFSGVTHEGVVVQVSLLPINTTSHLKAISISGTPADAHTTMGVDNFPSGQEIDLRAAGLYWT